MTYSLDLLDDNFLRYSDGSVDTVRECYRLTSEWSGNCTDYEIRRNSDYKLMHFGKIHGINGLKSALKIKPHYSANAPARSSDEPSNADIDAARELARAEELATNERRAKYLAEHPATNWHYTLDIGHYKNCPVCIGDCVCG